MENVELKACGFSAQEAGWCASVSALELRKEKWPHMEITEEGIAMGFR